MNVPRSYCLHSPQLSAEEDILIKKLLISHDPDGRRLDSQQLLRTMENIMCYATSSQGVSGLQLNEISDTEISGILEPIGQIISNISHQIFCKRSSEGDLHTKTMHLLEFLEKYKWDAKIVLVLAAFGTTYGEFWLIMQLYPQNPLAVSVAILKKLPTDIGKLKPRFKGLSLLVKTMVDVSKCIIKFESLPISELELDSEAEKTVNKTKFQIYLAAYWVTRSSLACSLQIKDFIAMKFESEYSNSTTIAAWELSSLVCRLSSINSCLEQQVDKCYKLIEEKMHEKLSKLFEETHSDNQEVLRILFALKDHLPLKHCPSQAKCGVSELKDKVLIVLISKPELLAFEELLFLVQQTYNHPCENPSDGKFEIVWVPISYHDWWTDLEERIFDLMSKFIPWYVIRQPWKLSSSLINYIKQDWDYKQEPLMIVLDSQGNFTHSNALDMIRIWGSSAYPFTISRETQLWEEQNWTLELIIDEIDSLLSKWVEEDRKICIYGSTDLDWIRKLNSKVKVIKCEGVQIEMVYVGKRNPDEHVKEIQTSIIEEMHSTLFSFTKIHFFWLRMESIRKSKLRLRATESGDPILEKVSGFFEMVENNRGWAVIGRGSSPDIVTLKDEQVLEFLDRFKEWNVKSAVEEPILAGSCNHSDIVPFDEKLVSSSLVCRKCNRVMKKFVVFE